MLVPQNSISLYSRSKILRCLLAVLLILFVPVHPLPAKNSEAPLRIPLDPLGFQPLSSQFLLAGSSLFTLHFVDDHHLLLTFAVHRLLSRLPDEPEYDQDRNMDALLLELPSGRVLARTSWRLHDHGRYLWSLGQGIFLLRIRDTLTSFAPLANLASGEPFREKPFLIARDRRIGAVILSPTADLLIVESVPRTHRSHPKTPLFGPTPLPERSPEPTSVQINFYRISVPLDGKQDNVQVRFAGGGRSNAMGTIASTSSGYLRLLDQGHQQWAFDFDSYTGETKELSPFDSTCRPEPYFVSPSEFIAFGCRSGETRHLLGEFNMRGEEKWEQNLFGDYIAPSFVFAPSSGRFALSRILVSSSVVSDQPLSSEELNSQTVVVFQTDSGKQILHVDCSPIEPAGQNFALSPNGLNLAVVHGGAIEVYSLPTLTGKEDAAVKIAQASAPAPNQAPIRFGADDTDNAAGSEATDTLSPGAYRGVAGGGDVQSPAPASADSSSRLAEEPEPLGDQSPDKPRKPPTLYTLPTDPPRSPAGNEPQ